MRNDCLEFEADPKHAWMFQVRHNGRVLGLAVRGTSVWTFSYGNGRAFKKEVFYNREALETFIRNTFSVGQSE